MLFSAPDPATYTELARVLRALPRVPVTDAAVDRAIEVRGELAVRSQHRAVPLPDLLIAACAEQGNLIVLHHEADFERIAEVTGQPIQWVVPRGRVS